MPLFTVEVRDRQGKKVTQTREGQSQADVVASLREAGFTVLKVSATSAAAKKKSVLSGSGTVGATALFKSDKVLPVSTMAQLCRQLGVMLKAGLSLVDALEIIRDEQEDLYFKAILGRVIVDVESGAPFAEALKVHEKAFTRLFVSAVEAGESSGSLDEILGQMGVFFKRRRQLQKSIKSATAYPKFIMGFFVLMLLGLFGWLLPQFEKVFEDLSGGTGGADRLPGLTKFLMGISDGVAGYWYITFPALGLIVFGLGYWQHTPGGSRKTQQWILKAPLFGDLVTKSSASRLSMTLGILIRNGVTLDQALEITAKTMDNIVFEEALKQVRTDVIQGSTLHKAIENAKVFPKLLTKMVKIGEESGSLPDMLAEVTSYYEDDVDTTVKQITALIEPAIIVLLGVVVTIVLLGIYLPIFQLSQAVGG